MFLLNHCQELDNAIVTNYPTLDTLIPLVARVVADDR